MSFQFNLEGEKIFAFMWSEILLIAHDQRVDPIILAEGILSAIISISVAFLIFEVRKTLKN